MIKPFITGLFVLITTFLHAQDLTATQTILGSAAPGSSFNVEITINRGTINGFMKLFQELPPGFTATEIDSKGGSFSFADNGAKIVWIAPPNETSYTVNYKVNVPADASGPKTLTAKLSYIHNNERKIFDLEPKTITISGNAVTNTQAAKTSTTAAKSQPATTTHTTTTTPSTPVTETPAAVTKSTTTSTPTTTTTASGKTYRVQIGAFSSKPKLGDVADITTIALANGITKYFSGNFNTLEEANKRKEELAKKGFPGAFIVAFENGKIAK